MVLNTAIHIRAQRLKELLEAQAGSIPVAAQLLRAVGPMIEAALSGQITTPMRGGAVPFTYPFLEGALRPYSDLEKAYVDFSNALDEPQKLFEDFGVAIYRSVEGYSVRYDAGHLVEEMREDLITEEEAASAQKSEKDAYRVLLAVQKRAGRKA